jgi:hypothetical protein
MWLVRAGCSMSPAEDALLLLAIVRRHLRSLELTLDAAYPGEDWGFTAQQAVEKLLRSLRKNRLNGRVFPPER